LHTKKAFAIKNREDIDQVFSANSVADIFDRLSKKDTAWSKETLDSLKKVSPTSLQITFEQIRQGAKLSFAKCFQLEYQLTQHLCSVLRTSLKPFLNPLLFLII